MMRQRSLRIITRRADAAARCGSSGPDRFCQAKYTRHRATPRRTPSISALRMSVSSR
jgi:hypothetical protein